MNYTANDIQNMVINKALIGGYKEDAVNIILDKIIDDYNLLIHENIELKDKINVLNEGIMQYKTIEESLNNTLLIAQQTAEDIKRNAHQKAENIVKEAEIRAIQKVSEANNEVLKIRFEYEELKKRLYVYKSKSESLLLSQLEIINQIFKDKELIESPN